MPLKRSRGKIDLTNEDDVKRLEEFEISLKDLPNEILMMILEHRSARDYLILSSTSKALAQRFLQIDNDMFRIFMRRDFKEIIPRELDARTAYIVRARLPIMRYFELRALNELDSEHDLVGRYFFRPSITMDLNVQIANTLEKVYPKTFGTIREEHNELLDYEYVLNISEPLVNKEEAWSPRWIEQLNGSSIAHIVKKLKTVDLIDASDTVHEDDDQDMNSYDIKPQRLMLRDSKKSMNDDDEFVTFFDSMPVSMNKETAYLVWQWHMTPKATHFISMWSGYHRQEPEEIMFKLFYPREGVSLRQEAARAIGSASPDDEPDAILSRQDLHQYEANVSADISRYSETIGDTLDLPPIDERFNVRFEEHAFGHTIGEIIQNLEGR